MPHAPRSPTVAKGLLLVAFLVCAIGMVGPFQGIEHAFVPWDKAAHFMAFYGLTLLLFTAFPRRRRLDLTVLAIFAGAATEVAQILAGRDGEFGDLCADALGALAVLAPVWLEHLRFPRRERRASGLGQIEVLQPERETA
ncbi:MAG: VanZ family protein [Phenylobacterium sp.]|uniref:VanZ family protein n=1 Tax=Phenylobacterium sp. TaxID=1871053 RepID=UPI002727C491|nr:VanZ family protein [Phenylobacterium sp.]MDO8912817.1 VanZ family protein [Phenylobacterium sp.]MDO9246013.1 VanZ family protein [Phenylobacterium sp.]MDP3101583.1 VanZ family protein [Phenylobacterium sp.]MDP3634547.1 VanZ family protein [Phenylobacterium sp.]HQT55119.1 VanZ family protein [Phenylobacterium sp.]